MRDLRDEVNPRIFNLFNRRILGARVSRWGIVAGPECVLHVSLPTCPAFACHGERSMAGRAFVTCPGEGVHGLVVAPWFLSLPPRGDLCMRYSEIRRSGPIFQASGIPFW